MSGGGSSYPSDSFTGNRKSQSVNEGVQGVDCLQLKLISYVVSPVMHYFSKYYIGKKLKIGLSDENTATIFDEMGNSIGTISPSRISELLKCLESGVEFVVTIISMNGAKIEVEVSAVEIF